MTFEEFLRLERKPGWKYEYWDGAAHISARPVVAPLILPLASRIGLSPPSPLPTEPVRSDDAPALISAFIDAFTGTAEYFEWPGDAIERSARECIETYFSGERGGPMAASRLARDRCDIAGAALIIKRRDGAPYIDLLMVRPAWQRRGLATAMVSAAVSDLRAAGEEVLTSGYNLANEASVAWLTGSASTERPDEYVARMRARYARLELDRLRRIGDLDAERGRRLEEECGRLEALAKRLEEEFWRRTKPEPET